ncbi:hypothetical protein GALL_523890 [mine drainage metagenome]|uniref:Uncharacterized protein n=1 Tax=mine drainage metagenome TaxID=410659 RepID=A0A1J5P4E9_9ZZZZ
MARISHEVGAHLLDPTQRRLVVEGHQHAFIAAAEQGRYRHRSDDQLHPAIDRHVVEIGRATGFRGRNGFAERGDDLGRTQGELGELILAQCRRQLCRGGIEVNDTAGTVQQYRRIRHAGDDGVDCRGFDRADTADIFTRRRDIVQPPRNQRGRGNAGKNGGGAHR